ncbi:MAG: alpha/beta fold hydrolase [Magnetococcales bacterium]|nr:alpha/beta fold hydrolase [Magnetococcales bacterium]
MVFLQRLLLVFLLGSGSEGWADALILTHGYFSGDEAWVQSGVTGELQSAGWEPGGSVRATARGIEFRPATQGIARRAYYLVDLPSEAPLVMQAQQFKEAVQAVRKQRGADRIVLIGHSAGGVVARLAMVRDPGMAIDGLITIAAPHLGTDKAEMVGLLASTPLSMVAPMMGADTLNRSRQLYDDLVRERPGSFLYWLNRQPHPKARYFSLIRRDAFVFFGDNTVPAWSQDMGKVAALKEVAKSATSGSDHALERQDGVELARILGEWLHD